MSELFLTGLDGKNPLGFLAALGVINALADHSKERAAAPMLAWRSDGTYRPVIVDGPDHDGLLDILTQDLGSFRDEPAIELLRYPKDGKEAHDLKPPPETFIKYLSALTRSERRRSLAIAAAFATDVAVDKTNGNTKPTALHFTAGRQEFLTTARELIDTVNPADLEEALLGPWKYEKLGKQFRWDNTSSRDYALRASDPSDPKTKLGVPGADWLAFRGLSFLRVAPVGDGIVTTGCTVEGKTGAFRWPLWTVPLSRPVIGSLLASCEVFNADPRVLSARGIAVVLESGISRSDQGGYGGFAPARVAGPSRPEKPTSSPRHGS